MANYDLLGNIAIMKFPIDAMLEDKLSKAKEIMNQYKSVKTVLEKVDKVRGRLRTIKTKYLMGENTLISNYLENGCKFKLNVETCYFSPRLANERLQVAKLLAKKKKSSVLVLFSGVGPFSIVIGKHSPVKKIVSVELGKDCCKYASQNVILNKLSDKIEVLQGDVNRIVPKLAEKKEKFDFIIMPRPNLKETFLPSALKVAKKGTMIIYYGFCAESKKEEMIEGLLNEAKKLKKKLKIINVFEAGDIAPHEHRYRIEAFVL